MFSAVLFQKKVQNKPYGFRTKKDGFVPSFVSYRWNKKWNKSVFYWLKNRQIR